MTSPEVLSAGRLHRRRLWRLPDARAAASSSRLKRCWPSNKMAVPDVRSRRGAVAGVYTIHKPDVNQGRVASATPHDARQPRSYALEVMNDISAAAASTSRITSRVRSDEGLAYSAGSNYGMGSTTPARSARRSSRRARPRRRPSRSCSTNQRIRTAKVSAEELRREELPHRDFRASSRRPADRRHVRAGRVHEAPRRLLGHVHASASRR